MTGGVASAGSVNHAQPVVFQVPNCWGQSAAYVAQGNFNDPAGAPFGLGRFAAGDGISLQSLHDDIQSFCATGIIP
jgi:hypothetical protein